jgi:Cof subfamily protein (haloacid dehalogenase superfamily)
MVVTDLDGTYLRTDKTVSEYTQNIFRLCREKGIKIASATGRGKRSERFTPELFNGRIYQNGAVAKSGNELVYQKLIPHEVARPFLLACEKRGLRVSAECDGMHYSNFYVSDIWGYIDYFHIVDFKQHTLDSEKLFTVCLSADDEIFVKSAMPENIHVYMNHDYTMATEQKDFWCFMSKDATKAKAISALADHWDIHANEIVAFGDDINDIDMLEYAGFSVAMGNAVNKVKEVATYVCDINDNDGVAKWIEENIL